MPTELSTRELEVAGLVARGYRNAQIAAELEIEVVTVKNHLQRVFKKLSISSRTQLMLWILGRAA